MKKERTDDNKLISFDDHVKKIPSLIDGVHPAFYIDFSKINKAVKTICKLSVKKGTNSRRVEFLNNIANTMVDLIETSEDYRTQKMAIDVFKEILLNFLSVDHFKCLFELCKRLMSKRNHKVYRRTACSLLSLALRTLTDEELINNIASEMIVMSKMEEYNGIQLDICDLLAKCSVKVKSEKVFMDIFKYFLNLVNGDSKDCSRANIALKIMHDKCRNKVVFYGCIRRYSKAISNIRSLSFFLSFISKGLVDPNYSVIVSAKEAFEALKYTQYEDDIQNLNN